MIGMEREHEAAFTKSDSGFISTNRVRFSPFEKPGGAYVTDWSPTHPVPEPAPSAAGGQYPQPQHHRQRSLDRSTSSSGGGGRLEHHQNYVPSHHQQYQQQHPYQSYPGEGDLKRDNYNYYQRHHNQ